MKTSFRMEWKDMGWASIYKKIQSEAAVHVNAGLVGAKGQAAHPLRGNLSVAEVGVLNEFGGWIPQRSFIRAALIWSPKAHHEFLGLMAQVSRMVMLQKVPRVVAMHIVGEWAVRRIKETILSNVPPPQAEATVAIKGHDHTLIHTGTLYDSIDYEIASGRGDE